MYICNNDKCLVQLFMISKTFKKTIMGQIERKFLAYSKKNEPQ